GIDFAELFSELGLPADARSGNLCCPFCGKRAFKPYDDGRAHCHACAWHGNAVRLYAEIKDIDRDTAFAELAELYNLKRIKPRRKTLAEARKALAADLDFLAWCRMYFAYYGGLRHGITHYVVRTRFSRPLLSKVLNGRFDLVSREAWHEVILMLRQGINIGAFRKDLDRKAAAWDEHIGEEAGLRESVVKFQ
ncbi:MAG: hypothetical protein AB7E55_28370, partial [Pigmentiphaga sp.]